MGEDSNGLPLPRLKFPFLPLINSSTMDYSSPEHPLQTRASIPFKWEEQPGKPRPCTDIIVRPEPVRLSLELPPSRKLQQYYSSTLTAVDGCYVNKITKTPSPTEVLDGPYKVGRSKFSSLRLFVRGSVHGTVLESSGSSESPTSVSTAMEGVTGKKKTMKNKVKGLFGKFNRSGSRKGVLGGGGGSFVFSSSSRFSPFSTTSCESDHCTAKTSVDGKMKRNRSISGLPSHSNNIINTSRSSSHLLASSIYEGLKQVMHWNSSRNSSRETHI